MIKVYCERGAYRPELSSLKRDGIIQLLHFPYEGKSRRVDVTKSPSLITMDMTCLTFDSEILISDMCESDRYPAIVRCLGGENWRDALHLDSAHKSGCRAFLTRDKADISGRKEQLEPIVGLRIFHSDEDWPQFLEFINSAA